MSSNAKRVEAMTDMLTQLKGDTTIYTEKIDHFIDEFSTLPDIIIRSMEFSQQQKTWLLDLVEDKLRVVISRAFMEVEEETNGS